MPDPRIELYRRYVSTFKQFEQPKEPLRERNQCLVFASKYLPHLSHLNPEDHVLEIGCGPGNLLAYLVARGYSNVEGLDISLEQLEIAEARGLKVHCADVFEFLKQRSGAYEAIIAIDFVEHFTKDEVLRLFPAVFRALKRGGVLLLQTPNGEGLFPNQIIYGDLSHCTTFTPTSLVQALRLAGFTDPMFDETGPVSESIKGWFRRVAWWCIKSLACIIRNIETGKRQKLWAENFICCCRKPYE